MTSAGVERSHDAQLFNRVRKALSNDTREGYFADIGKRRQNDKRKKRRTALLLALLNNLRQTRQKRYQGRPFPVKRKKRKDFWKVVRLFNRRQFRNAFRMTCAQFQKLTAKLRPMLDHNKIMTERSSGPIPS